MVKQYTANTTDEELAKDESSGAPPGAAGTLVDMMTGSRKQAQAARDEIARRKAQREAEAAEAAERAKAQKKVGEITFKKGGSVPPAFVKAMEKQYPKGATITPKKYASGGSVSRDGVAQRGRTRAKGKP